MLEVVSGVAVFTALCLSIPALRLYGVFGLSILAMLFPVVVLVLAILAGAVFVFARRNPSHSKGASNVIRELFVGRR
jgi:hypothetical protein